MLSIFRSCLRCEKFRQGALGHPQLRKSSTRENSLSLFHSPIFTNNGRSHDTAKMGTGKKEASRKERQGKTGDGMGNVKVKGENFYRYVPRILCQFFTANNSHI